MTEPSFTCHAAALKRALAFASSVVERHNCIPILGMVRIAANHGACQITGTDLDTEAMAEIETVDQLGGMDFTMNPRLLRQIIGELAPEALVRFEAVPVDKGSDIVRITADGLTANLRVLCPSTDWPEFVAGDCAGLPITVAEGQLREALAMAWPCISSEETRYYLNGIFMHDRGKGLISAATDGHRIAIFDSGIGWGLPDAIWSRYSLARIMPQLKRGGNDPLTITAYSPGGTKFKIQGPGWRLRFKTIDGTFPDYNRVVPKWETKATATLTAAAMRRIPDFAERVQAVALDTGAGTISSRDPCLEVDVTMPLHVDGDHFRIGFNRKYLAAFAAQSGTIKLELHSPGDPARVQCDDPRLLRVLMPMRI